MSNGDGLKDQRRGMADRREGCLRSDGDPLPKLHASDYGEDVHKTGEFQWMEELAEDLIPVDSETDDANEDVQYVMYLGTNDKDTDKPVFTQAEAMVKAREILMSHFGGYTIQEAHGGWVGDDGTEYQEYTLVIYLSDITEDAVHAAADELIATFNQSSVLIHANPTKTEFYSGK